MTDGVPPTDAARSVAQRMGPLAVVLVALLFLPGLVGHARYALRDDVLADDARQQAWPIECYARAPQFCDDYPGRFYLDQYPLGYRAIARAGLAVLPARQFTELLPYFLVAVVAGLLAWGVAGSEGWGMAALTVVMVGMTDEYLARMAGGIPRAFGYPLLALAYAGLLRDRPWMIAAAAVGGALFHPPIGLLAGCLLATHQFALIVVPGLVGSPRRPSIVRRIALVSGTALVSAVLLVPVIRGGEPYGPVIQRDRLAAFPELGPSGRYTGEDAPLRPHGLFEDAVTGAMRAFANRHDILASILGDRPAATIGGLARLGALAVVGLGTLLALRRHPHARGLFLAVPISVALYLVAAFTWPRLYQPQRYVGYAVPPLLAALTPIAFRALAESIRGLERRAVAAATAGVVLLVVLVGGVGPGTAGLSIVVPPAQMALLHEIGRLPATAEIAGWPGNQQPVESVPLLAMRRAFVTYETHQIFHERYGLTMRDRMNALTVAYLAATPAALATLRDQHGVTHLIVDREGLASLEYFEPFDSLRRRLAPPADEMRRRYDALAASAGIYDDRRYLLLDLARLPAGAGP